MTPERWRELMFGKIVKTAALVAIIGVSSAAATTQEAEAGNFGFSIQVGPGPAWGPGPGWGRPEMAAGSQRFLQTTPRREESPQYGRPRQPYYPPQ